MDFILSSQPLNTICFLQSNKDHLKSNQNLSSQKTKVGVFGKLLETSILCPIRIPNFEKFFFKKI